MSTALLKDYGERILYAIQDFLGQYVYFLKRHDFFHTRTNSLVCYAVFEYLAVKCIEQRAKEATQRAQKTEATTIGKR